MNKKFLNKKFLNKTNQKIRGKSLVAESSKLLKDENFTDKLLLLDIIDYLIDYAKDNFNTFPSQVANKDFMNTLLQFIKSNNKLLQNKILYLIKKWENKFKTKKKNFPIFSETYENLLAKKINFPQPKYLNFIYYLINILKALNTQNI